MIEKFEAMCVDKAMVDYFKQVNEAEEKNFRLSRENFENDLQGYELAVNMLAQTLNEINESYRDKVLEPEKKSAIIQLAYRFLIASKCLFNIVQLGYYYEAYILLRNMQENVFYCWSFSESNECAEKWYSKKLSLGDAKRAIKYSSRQEIKQAYDFLCDFVHLNMVAVAQFNNYPHEEEYNLLIADTPKFSEREASILEGFRGLNSSMLLILVQVFRENLDKKAQEVIRLFIADEHAEFRNNSKLEKE